MYSRRNSFLEIPGETETVEIGRLDRLGLNMIDTSTISLYLAFDIKNLYDGRGGARGGGG